MTRGVSRSDISCCGYEFSFSRRTFRITNNFSEDVMYMDHGLSAVIKVTRVSKCLRLGVASVCFALASPKSAFAQKATQTESMPAFAPVMIDHMHKMRRYRDPDRGAQHTPRVIDRFSVDLDPKGAIASFQPNGATLTSNNAFFKDMGTNGRTCFTCHQPQNGWGVSAKRCRGALREKCGYRSDFSFGRRRHLSE